MRQAKTSRNFHIELVLLGIDKNAYWWMGKTDAIDIIDDPGLGSDVRSMAFLAGSELTEQLAPFYPEAQRYTKSIRLGILTDSHYTCFRANRIN